MRVYCFRQINSGDAPNKHPGGRVRLKITNGKEITGHDY